MSNSFLSPTIITREALRVLHSNMQFCKNIYRGYDDKFANSGASMSGKIGPTLTIRKPNKYTVRTGAALQLQDVTETTTSLSVSNQYGVDISFTSSDLTLTIDEFSDRYLKPAMSRLAAEIDYQAMTALLPTVYNAVDIAASDGDVGVTPSAALTYLKAGQKLDENLAPRDSMRRMLLSPAAQAATVDSLKGLFQKSDAIASQYDKGEMGTALGFDFAMSQLIPSFTTGTRTNTTPTGDASAWVNGSTTIVMTSGTTSGTFTKGDTFTVAGVYSVNDETKQSTGSLQRFVVTTAGTNSSGGATVNFTPAVYISGAQQNVTASSYSATAAIIWMGEASTVYTQNVAFHPEAFTMATADLIMPKGVDFAARQVMDNISMRVVRAYDINNDRFPCRFDILAGWKELYPQWACRVFGDVA